MSPDTPPKRDLRAKFKEKVAPVLAWVRRYIPPGLRLVAGILLIVGGVFGILPVLGFWMIPLGIVIAWMDIKPIWKLIRDRLF